MRSEEQALNNMHILNMISRKKLILDSTRSTGFSAVKLTALGRPNLLVSRLRRDQDIGRGKSREFKIHHMNPKFPKNPPQKIDPLKFTLIHV